MIAEVRGVILELGKKHGGNFIMPTLKEKLYKICRDFHILSLYAFGSRAKEISKRIEGEPVVSDHPTSDLDIGVQPAKGALRHPRDRVALTQALEDLFHVPRVDLVILPEAPVFLAVEVIRGELLYCDNEDRQSEEELYYLRRAGDLAYFQKQRLQGILDGTLRS